MREAIHRLTAPLFDWIPDISGAPARRQATIGVAASILLHCLIIALFLIFSGIIPVGTFELARPKPRVQEIELTIIPPAPPPEPIVTNPSRPFLDSRGLNESKEPAPNALVESDKNMKAASENPASGDLPLPSQDGLKRPDPAFKSQQDTAGAGAASAPMTALYQPQPIPRQFIDPVKQEPARDMPQPAPAIETPPKPEAGAEKEAKTANQLDKPKSNDIPLSAKKIVRPQPKDAHKAVIDRPHPVPIQQPAQQMARLVTPAPQPKRAAAPGYQPQLEKTRIEGSISNRGKAAVDAMSTPLARYKKQVNDAIGSRWYFYIHRKMDLIAAGSVNISFSIDDRGRILGIAIQSNTSNASFADVCAQAVREAEIAPPPPDLIAPMKDGRLDYSLTFTFYTL